jgi:hypothetical protein
MLNLVTPIQETRANQSSTDEGKADVLRSLLTRRFGPLPTWRSCASSTLTWNNSIFGDLDDY